MRIVTALHTNINELDLPSFYAHVVDPQHFRDLLSLAAREDLSSPRTDITSLLLNEPHATLTAALRTRTFCTVSGLAALPEILDVFAPDATLSPSHTDGQPAPTYTTLATITAPACQLLAAERTMLNIVAHLSGIATLTAKFVEKTRDTNAHIYDTRKTTPGLRTLEKYAVRCGNGRCHRMGLHDSILLKDNHIQSRTGKALTAWLNEILPGARQRFSPSFVEVEVDTLIQLEAVLATDPDLVDIILLDNFSPDQLLAAVAMRKDMNRTTLLEASGGITLKSVAAYARTGIERIAVGTITHSAPAADIALDLID